MERWTMERMHIEWNMVLGVAGGGEQIEKLEGETGVALDVVWWFGGMANPERLG